MILSKGSSGEDVKAVQAALRSRGFYGSSAIDGFFGSSTEQAVRDFQASAGLDVDGVAGMQTLSKLLDPTSQIIALPFSPAVSQWASWLMRAQGDSDPFPIDKALQWIKLESGGNPCATGRIQGEHVMEAGLAQTYFETPATVCYGFTSSQLRALCACIGTSQHGDDCTDQAKAAHAQVALLDMKAHRSRARAKLAAAGVTIDEGTPDFWSFVKLVHALPGVYSYLRLCGAQNWPDFKRWVLAMTPERLAAIDRGTARYAGAFARVFENCEAFAG